MATLQQVNLHSIKKKLYQHIHKIHSPCGTDHHKGNRKETKWNKSMIVKKNVKLSVEWKKNKEVLRMSRKKGEKGKPKERDTWNSSVASEEKGAWNIMPWLDWRQENERRDKEKKYMNSLPKTFRELTTAVYLIQQKRNREMVFLIWGWLKVREREKRQREKNIWMVYREHSED